MCIRDSYYIKQTNASKTVNMRNDHDKVNDWMFETAVSPVNVAAGNTDTYPANNVPFVGSTQLMDRADMELAKDLLYGQFGWDKDTGMPTTATLNALGLGYVKTAIPALIP